MLSKVDRHFSRLPCNNNTPPPPSPTHCDCRPPSLTASRWRLLSECVVTQVDVTGNICLFTCVWFFEGSSPENEYCCRRRLGWSGLSSWGMQSTRGVDAVQCPRRRITLCSISYVTQCESRNVPCVCVRVPVCARACSNPFWKPENLSCVAINF